MVPYLNHCAGNNLACWSTLHIQHALKTNNKTHLKGIIRRSLSCAGKPRTSQSVDPNSVGVRNFMASFPPSDIMDEAGHEGAGTPGC